MLEKRGRNIKKGTLGYVLVYECDTNLVVTHHIDLVDVSMYDEIFTYDPEDELWAMASVRIKWNMSPYRHPQYTLFQAITAKYKN